MEGLDLISDLAVVLLAAAIGGFAFKKAGLSPILGYLLAGVVIGPYSPPFSFLQDDDRIQTLSQIGLIFLMFSIGLSFSITRLRQMGMGFLFGTFGTAMLVLLFGRFVGHMVGFSSTSSLFLAAMLMVSSSAVIGKVLSELNLSHTRWGQLAMGVTLTEDVVAVVMLTLLGSYIQIEGEGSSVFRTIAIMISFIVGTVILGILIIPYLLKKIKTARMVELETIFASALLFGLATLAFMAGYSIALGAFLLGVVISETPERMKIDKAFFGTRDIFTAVFFVAIGMTINVNLIPQAWMWILGITAIAVIGRTIAAFCSFTLLGSDGGAAVRSAMCLIPLGEFSFVLAQLGVSSGYLSEPVYVGATTAAILTTFLTPVMIGKAEVVGAKFDRFFAGDNVIAKMHGEYRKALGYITTQNQGSVLMGLLRKRIIQAVVEILFITALLAFSRQILDTIISRVHLFDGSELIVTWVFWGVITFLVLLPLVAIWRNLSAMSLIIEDFMKNARSDSPVFAKMIGMIFLALTSMFTLFWILSFAPIPGYHLWTLITVIAILAMFLAVFWRKIIHWHSQLEVSFESVLKNDATGMVELTNKVSHHNDWALELNEFTLPENTTFAGRTIRECSLRQKFGVNVVAIERQGILIANLRADTQLFPGDRLLVIGTSEQIGKASSAFEEEKEIRNDNDFESLTMETVRIPDNFQKSGKPLDDLKLTSRFGVQVVGLRSQNNKSVEINAGTKPMSGDVLLVVGSHASIEELRKWMEKLPVTPKENRSED